MTCRAKSTSCRPAQTASFIAVAAPKLSFHGPVPSRRKLRAIAVAGGCALLAAMAVAPGAAAQAQNRASDPRVALQSLHPIVEQVLPAVVNVSVAIKEAEEGELAGPEENDKSPNLPTSPFDEFLRRYFGGQSPQAPGAEPSRAAPRASPLAPASSSTRPAMSSPTITSSSKRGRSPSFFRTIADIPPSLSAATP